MTFSDAVPGTDGEELTEPPTQVKSVKLVKIQCQMKSQNKYKEDKWDIANVKNVPKMNKPCSYRT